MTVKTRVAIYRDSSNLMKKNLNDGRSLFYEDINGLIVPIKRPNDKLIQKFQLRQLGFEGDYSESLSNKCGLVRVRVPNVSIKRARIWFRNYANSSAVITGAMIRGVPTTTSTSGGTWEDITLTGGYLSVDARIASTTQETTHFYPGEACTDWFIPSTVARTDGGTDFLFDIVLKCEANGIGNNLAGCDTVGWYSTTDDLILSKPSSISLSTTYASTSAWIEVESYCGTTKKPIFIVNGDSTFSSTEAGSFGSYQYGINAYGGESFTASIGGSISKTSHENLLNFLPFVDAECVVVQMYSVNDALKIGGQSPSNAVYDSIEFASKIAKMGYKVIQVSAMPASARYTEIGEARTILKNSGMLFFDPCLTASDNPDVSCTWKAGYNLDAYHPNNTGRTAIGNAFSSWLTTNYSKL